MIGEEFDFEKKSTSNVLDVTYPRRDSRVLKRIA